MEKFQIKAQLLAEEAYSIEKEALEKSAKVQMRVPVTMKGALVGYGNLSSDGSMLVQVEKNPAGREIIQMLLTGTANCLSLGPNTKGPTTFSED